MKIAVVLDLEGVLLPPGIDFAFMILEASTYNKEEIRKEVTDMLSTFDKFDDERWLYYKYVKGEPKYQTGTTPFYSLMLTTALGVDKDVISMLCEKILGIARLDVAKKIIDGIRELSDLVVIASSAYHEFVNKFLEKTNAKIDQVYATGNTILDGVQNEDIIKELRELYTREVLLKICELVYYYALICLKKSKYDIFEKLFKVAKVSNIEYVEKFLVNQRGVAGSLLKAQVVRKLREKGFFTIFVGDSVVDVDAAEVANISISINTSSRQLLNLTTFNVITRDYTVLVDIIRLIVTGKIWALKEELRGRCEILSRVEVSESLNRIAEINRKMRSLIASEIREEFVRKVLQGSTLT